MGSVDRAGLNAKGVFSLRRPALPGEMFDQRQGGRPFGEFRQKTIQGRRLAFDFDEDGAGLVLDEAVQLQSRGEGVHKGTEPDALNDAAHHDGPAFHEDVRSRPESRRSSRVATSIPAHGVPADSFPPCGDHLRKGQKDDAERVIESLFGKLLRIDNLRARPGVPSVKGERPLAGVSSVRGKPALEPIAGPQDLRQRRDHRRASRSNTVSTVFGRHPDEP